MNFKRSANNQPRSAFLTTLIENNFPFYSFIYQNISAEPISIKPNYVQTFYFPLKDRKTSVLKIENIKPLPLKNLILIFLLKLNDIYNFWEYYRKKLKIRAR